MAAYRKVLIVCPALTRTGGPEALHQLGRALLDRGQDAAMVYVADDEAWFSFSDGVAEVPALPGLMPDAYAPYAVPRATVIPDAADVAVVVPEIWPWLVRRFRHAAVHLWWLSVDNGVERLRAAGGLAALGERCVHLCQSRYALDWLAARGVRGAMLSDYTSPAMAARPEAPAGRREARVLFAPRGRAFALRLRDRVPEVEWRELAGLAPEVVRELFLTSRLYVDFGAHPGRDRMPREAAMLGCCVMTGRRGAAGNDVDVAIPDRYKFRENWLTARLAARAVRRVLRDYASCTGDFAAYRTAIAGEREVFAREVAAVFGDGR